METNNRICLQNRGDSLALVLIGATTIDLFLAVWKICRMLVLQPFFKNLQWLMGDKVNFSPTAFKSELWFLVISKFLTAK